MKEVSKYLQMLKEHDYSTYLHSKRVERLSILIGEKLALSEKEINELSITALLHDIGKLKIPTEVLSKEKPLTEKERLIIKCHPINGAEMARGHFSSNIIDGIESHHEFFNGKGYPYNIKGDDIPVYSRIIAVADALDAMTNVRPYRKKPLSADEALSEIEVYANYQFDPYIVKKLVKQMYIKNL